MSCGTKHADEKCPQCASKKKKVGFYISYLIPI
jgi:rubrerythrin